VAVADQFEDDSGGHYREITRLITPGTLIETTDAEAQYLAAVVRAGGSGDDTGPYGLAFADITTGQFHVTEVDTADEAHAELYRFDPVEVLPGPEVRTDDGFARQLRERSDASLSLFDTDAFAPGRSAHTVREQFGRETVDSIGLDSDLAVRAAGAVLAYVEETGVGVRQSMIRLQVYTAADHLTLDATTQRNLELVETMHGDRTGSLVDTIDHTETSPCVDALAAAALPRERLRETLDGGYDLERLASRAASGSANARDLLSVRDTLDRLPAVADEIAAGPLADSPLSTVVDRPDRDAAADLRETLDEALADDPPKTVTQGGLFKYGFDDELDELIERHREVEEWLDGLADRLKRQHGLSHVTRRSPSSRHSCKTSGGRWRRSTSSARWRLMPLATTGVGPNCRPTGGSISRRDAIRSSSRPPSSSPTICGSTTSGGF